VLKKITLENPKALVFVRYYLPGFKSGGPVRSIANMVDRLSTDFDFYILTLDRDYLDTEPFRGIEGGWNLVGGSRVRYLPKNILVWKNIVEVIEDLKPDFIYLNSLFDPIFSLPWILKKTTSKNGMPPVICAPRGELAEGALRFKSIRKTLVLSMIKLLGVHKRITFHATSEPEMKQIFAKFVRAPRVELAGNITTASGRSLDSRTRPENRKIKRLQIVFISRIHPKKNLHYAIECLSKTKCRAIFTIYGPIDDVSYWRNCQERLLSLPSNVEVDYRGELPHKKVLPALAEHDVFFFPTLGENFGHVIHEALEAGCVLLLSDQTPWTELRAHKIGWDLPLSDIDKFVSVIEKLSQWDAGDWQTHQNAVDEFKSIKIWGNTNDKSHKSMFSRVMSSEK